jgi:hypothetical protein
LRLVAEIGLAGTLPQGDAPAWPEQREPVERGSKAIRDTPFPRVHLPRQLIHLFLLQQFPLVSSRH